MSDGQTGAGPGELLAAAYDAYAGSLYRYALLILADHGAAEDAIHDAFTRLARMGRRLRKIDSYDGYLRTAVRNECYRILRRRQRRGRKIDVVSVDSMLEATESGNIYQDERVAVESALRSLPADQREVVYLKIYRQMTFQQIADELDVSINTITSRYRYAMDKLRRILASDHV
ncbi:MAG: sigma-70 family RNA polymerase sigma factor [Planctomycetota bacterium]|nr:MAG: sigma-70 family RNA polymerase sigma factor [Planctomycetota bacterium]